MSAKWPSHGSSSATRWSFGHATPSEPSRRISVSASAKNRFADTMTGTRSGTGASSATRTKRSSTIWPFSTSGIDALPERLDAGALDRVDEQLVGPLPQFEIGRGDVLDHVGDLRIGHGRADQRAKRGVLVGLAAKRDLIKLLAVLLDAENADMADMVMPAGIDAAGNVDVQPAEVARQVAVAEAARDFLRDRDRTRIGEAAVIEARAGDDVGHQVDVQR